MMIKSTDDIFMPDNEVNLPKEFDYGHMDEYIRSVETKLPII